MPEKIDSTTAAAGPIQYGGESLLETCSKRSM